MNYIVTARKWRPQTFAEVVGQEHITTTIKNSIINKRVAHAFLLTGPRGCGKTTTARIIAKAINCLNQINGEPCNECAMCQSFLNSQSLDIIEIDGASNRRIEEIRTLRESVKYAPTAGKYKVYIIDEVHMLTTESFNALLKTLEEPPEHTIFIFATTDVHKVPPTIISRCQRFDFRRIEMNLIKSHLKKIASAEGIEIDDIALTLIAKKADGALRDAQSLFDQVISFSGNKVDSGELAKMFNLIDEEIYFAISDSVLNKTFNEAFNISQKIYDNGWNYFDFVNGLIEHFRNIITVVIRKSCDLIETAEIYHQRYLECKEKFSEGDLIRILSFLNRTQYELKSSSNPKVKIEVALIHLIGLEKSSTISELLSKLGKEDFSEPKVIAESGGGYSVSKPSNQSISNLRPAYKEEVKIPKVESFVLPKVTTNTNFDELVLQWQNFVDQVKNEKVFFGSILHNSTPVFLSEEQVNLEVEHNDDEDIIKNNETYLDKKTKEVFGKRIKVSVSSKAKQNKSAANLQLNGKKEETNPLAKAIIEQLGGREIIKS